MSGVNPFLGARPYGPADDAVFFGRASATAALVERIALQPLTIVSAPSGIGKTSLLRAAVLPELEREGLCVVYLRPDPPPSGDSADPLLGDRMAQHLADALILDPEAERACLQSLRQNPFLTTVGHARDWFQTLTPNHATRGALLKPPEGVVDRLPMLARYLRGTVRLEAIAAQLSRFGVSQAESFSEETLLSELEGAFGSAELTASVAAARAQLLSVPADVSPAIGLLRRLVGAQEDSPFLVRPDGDPDCQVSVLLVVDQFEQLFTLAKPEKRDVALRQIESLLDAGLSVGVVLALRKEWYADLLLNMPSLRRKTETAGRTTFHLLPLKRDEAEEIMVKAPAQVGVERIRETQRRELWEGLQVDETIDAVTLSIACHELIARRDEAATLTDTLRVVDLLTAYLNRAIESIPPEDRAEALDMLGEIAGTGKTRNFVTHERLVKAPLRDPERRAKILSDLQRAFLVKGDNLRRDYDKVYDVIHERLLGALQTYIADRPEIAAFRAATERLIQAERGGLDWQNCCCLLSGWDRLKLDPRSAAILLLSIVREFTHERVEEAAALRGPLASFAKSAGDPHKRLRSIFCEVAARAADRPEIAPSPARRWWLGASEIRDRLRGVPDEQADRHALVSALRAPAGRLREAARELAARLAQAPAPARREAVSTATGTQSWAHGAI